MRSNAKLEIVTQHSKSLAPVILLFHAPLQVGNTMSSGNSHPENERTPQEPGTDPLGGRGRLPPRRLLAKKSRRQADQK